MYGLPEILLVANPIDRYLINSPMLPDLMKDAGGRTIDVQNASSGKDKEANLLAAPKGPFYIAMRLNWPMEAELDGSRKQPPMIKVT